ncbi:MAG: ompH [bacterium]|nr:MAG: ompH [bacterium]KAF0150420.1 MAG: ompH [bacterium]KAF0168977.1 MAG: ompH [bacterium]TXT32840.1 MAG: ompH [Rhodocyclaceae bacterium]
MKRLILIPLLLLFSSLAFANTSLKIGFVNTEKVFRESALAVRAQKKLETEFKNREQEIQKQVKLARDLQASLERESLTLSESDRRKKQNELTNLSRELQQAQRDFREDLNTRKNEEFAAVQDRARKIIAEIAEKEKYDLIVENVIFASPKVDITDRVLKALDR